MLAVSFAVHFDADEVCEKRLSVEKVSGKFGVLEGNVILIVLQQIPFCFQSGILQVLKKISLLSFIFCYDL